MGFFKQEGNNHYKNGRLQEASYCYQKAIVISDYTFPEEEEGVRQIEELVQQCHCNLAIVLVKLEKWEEVETHLNQARKGPAPKIKAKALYWTVKQHIRKAQYD